MKKIVLLLLIVLLMSCDTNNDSENLPETNKVVLLQVDFLTNTFEGGKELEFTASSNFTITSNYHAPGDFGSVQLYYDELNEMIFDGAIIWMGTGQRSYPETIDTPNNFSTSNESLPLPDLSSFEKVMYTEYAYYPEDIEYNNIWESINNLEIVYNYRNSNPNGKINLFLYTPSVGIGNPNEWDWFVILKN